jgi:ferredoxin
MLCHPGVILIERKRSRMGKRVVIEEEECVGCENCIEFCPDVFEFDEQRKPMTLSQNEAMKIAFKRP